MKKNDIKGITELYQYSEKVHRMAKYNNTVTYNLKTTLDASGLTKLQNELNVINSKVQQMTVKTLVDDKTKQETLKSIEAVQQALNKSFNPKMGMLDISKFQKQLQGLPLTKIQQDFKSIGIEGEVAFANMVGALGKIDIGLKSTNKAIDKFKQSIANTVRWGIISSTFNRVTDSLWQSVEYVKELDSSLTQIMMVTDYSRDNMNAFAQDANIAAKALGTTTTAMTNAALVFAQQGFNLKDSQQLAELSTKLANASQQDTATTSDQITAYMNAYGLDKNLETLADAMDSWAEVANVSAADVAELAQASQKAASTASTVGVTMDQLNGQIATIESVTREAPEQIGNGLKTLYARFSDLKAGNTLDDGITLGKVTEQLQKFGVQVLDGDGQLKAVGDIMEELMDVWQELSQTQKAAVAQVVAGKYQLGRFEALMNRADLYDEYKGASENAEGTLDEMNMKFVNSLEGRLNKLQSTLEGVFSSIFNTDDIYPMVDALTDLVNLLDSFTKAIGGGGKALQAFGAIGLRIFSQDIGSSFGNLVSNFKSSKDVKRNLQMRNAKLQELDLLGIDDSKIEGTISFLDNSLDRSKAIAASPERIAAHNKLLEERKNIDIGKMQVDDELNSKIDLLNTVYAREGVDNLITKNRNGDYDFSNLIEQEKSGTAIDNFAIKNMKWAGIGQFVNSLDDTIKDNEDRVSTIKGRKKQIATDTHFMDDLDAMEATFNELPKALRDITSGPIADIKAIINEYRQRVQENEEKYASGEKKGRLTPTEANKYTQRLSNATERVKKVADAVGEDDSPIPHAQELINKQTKSHTLKDSGDVLNTQIQDFFKTLDVSTAVEEVAKLTAGFGELSFAISTIQNIGSIWSNEDLTSSEKLLQTILALGAALPTAISGFKDIQESLDGLNVLVERYTEIYLKKQAVKQADIATDAEKAVSSAASIAAEKEETQAVKKQTSEKVKNIGVSKIQTKEKLAGAAGSAALAAGETSVGVAAQAAMPKIAAMLNLFTPFLIGGAVVAGIALVFKTLIDNYNSAAMAADKAAKASQAAYNAFSNTKNSYDTFTSEINAYRDAQTALKELEMGTKEWNQALNETNQQVLNLLEKYPELASYINRGADNSLQISDEGLNAIQQKMQDSLASSQLNLAAAKTNEATANLDHFATELSRSVKAAEKIKVNTTVTRGDTTLRPVTKVTGRSRIIGLDKESASNILTAVQQEGTGILSDPQEIANILGTDSTNPIIEAIQNNADRIIQAANEIQEKKTAADIYAKEAVRDKISALGYDTQGSTGQNLVDLTASYAKQHSTDKYDHYMSASEEELKKAYSTQTGYLFENKDGNTFQFSNQEGNAIPVTREEMASFLAASDALNQAASRIDRFSDMAMNISTSQAAEDISDTSLFSRTKDEGFKFSNLRDKELNSASNSMTDVSSAATYLNFTNSDGSADINSFNQYAAELGYKDATEYVNAFNTALSKRQNEIQEAKNLLISGTKDGSVGIDTTASTFSSEDSGYQTQASEILSVVESLGDLDTAFANNRITIDDYNKGLANLGNGYEELRPLAQKLNSAQAKYNRVLKNANHTMEESAEATEELIAAEDDLRDALAIKEIDKARNKLKDYADELSNSDQESKSFKDATEAVADGLKDLLGQEVNSDWVKKYANDVQDFLNGLEGSGAKLQSLFALDHLSEPFKQTCQEIGADYAALTEAISNNTIQFNAEGIADFSQFNAEMAVVDGVTKATSDQLQVLAAYLQAMGGASLILKNDANETKITTPPKRPDFSGMTPEDSNAAMANYATELQNWMNDVAKDLENGWAFSGIELPESPYTVPTTNPVGSGGGGKKGGGGGGKKGGGGGGKGSSGKKYTPKENKKPIDNEVDRYEKVNTQLAAIGADYDLIASSQDRLSGDKILGNLQQQNSLIQKQIDLYETKLKIQKEELAEVQGKLQSDFGITFDGEGLMQNYAQVHQALIDEVNRLNSQYSSVTSEAEEKALDAKVEAAQERLSTFEDLYKRYDSLLSSDIKDTIKQIKDLKDALEDLHIQAIRMTFEIAGNIKEINEAVSVILTPKEVWFDENPLEKAKHLIGDIDKFFDDPTVNDEYYDKQIKAKEEELSKTTDETRKKRLEQDIANLKESKEQQGKGTIDKAGSGYIDMLFGNADFSLKEIEEYKATGKSSVYGENGAALYEDALKNLTALASGIEELRSKVKELQQTINDAVSDAIEKCDELNHKYELINEDLEHQRDLVELVYGEKSFKEQRALIDAQIANNKAQIASQKRIIEEKKAMLATLDKDSEAYKNLKQSIEESESAVKDLTTSTVELQREAQKLATEEAISAMEKNFLGTDLEWAQTQWELINKQADMYLDDVNKAYNIQKLQNKYLNMLEKSNDLDIQQQITAQMDEQLGKLREKTKLSEYDVQYANAQLDILQKKIALEEAQRNKSEMKLRRDSQGNYSYVYTANDADLSAAQDSLLDAENNAYNMSKEHMIQMNNEKYAALQDFFEKFRQIRNDMTISEEERTKRLQELQDANREILNAISEQLGVSQENMLKDFSDITELILEENAGNLNDINEAIVNGNKDAMDQLDQRWTASLDKIGKFGDAFSEKNKEVIDGLNTTLKGYETSVNEVASNVSGGFDTITESIKESQEATSNLNTETNALVESLQKTTGEIGKTQEKINGYIAEIELGNEKIEGLENTVKRLQAELLEEQRKRLLAEQAAANGNSSAAAGGGGAGGGGSATSNNGNAEIGDAVTYNGGAFWYRSNPLGGDPHGTTSAGSMVYITNINPNGKYPYHISRGPHLGSGDLGWLSLSQLSGYDTGGYTGSWGENTFDNKNGKLAVLHQKELVLNATDTANILTAVSAVRDMAQIFKMNSLEGIASSISNSLNNYQTIPQLGQDVNQNVHITAEFPNVSSSAEIEQALLTLNDRAMQYAFKNR